MLEIAVVLVRAVSIALLIRIAINDFMTQKIANKNVLALAALSIAGLLLSWAASGSAANLIMGFAAAAGIFFSMLLFWLLGKVGAGDVKFMAVAPLLAGGEYLFSFSILLLGFALITAIIIKMPFILPKSAFRKYVEVLGVKGLVPYGVPISAALLSVILLQTLGTPLITFGTL